MQGLQYRPSVVVLLYFEYRPGLCNAAVEQNNRSKLPILTPMHKLKNTIQKNTKNYTKTSHFFAFFSIFPLLFQKVLLFFEKMRLFFLFSVPL